MQKPTKEQEQAVEVLLEWYKKDMFYPTYSLTGSAGTGKTTTINHFLNKLFPRKSDKSVIVTAPTHKAKTIIMRKSGRNGETIQALLGLAPDVLVENYDPNKPVFAQKKEPKIKDYKLIVIDEGSMVPSHLYVKIKTLAQDYGVKVLFTGDIRQLPPVKETVSLALLNEGSNFELKTIIRQNIDNPMMPFLTAICNDIDNNTNTFGDLIRQSTTQFNYKGEGYAIIRNLEEFKNYLIADFQSEEFKENIEYAKLVTYENDSVRDWTRMIRNIIVNSDDRFVPGDVLMSYANVMGEFNEIKLYNSLDYSVKSVVPYESTFGIRGELLNLCTSEVGEKVNPILVVEEGDIPKFIEIYEQKVYFAKSQIGSRDKAKAWADVSAFKNDHLLLRDIYDEHYEQVYNKKSLICKKSVDYGYALTIHKSQGSTYDHVYVDISNIRNVMKYERTPERKKFMLHLLYVAMSRASKKIILLV